MPLTFISLNQLPDDPLMAISVPTSYSLETSTFKLGLASEVGKLKVSAVPILPGLIVGKIASVSKNPSDLFQKAEIQSNIDFTKIETVFIVTNIQ